MNRGDAYVGLNQNQDALTDFLKVTTECPDYAEAWLRAGTTYYKLQKKNEAKKYLMEAKRRDPDGPWGREAEKLLRMMGSGSGAGSVAPRMNKQ